MSWSVGNITLAQVANSAQETYTIVLTLVRLVDGLEEEWPTTDGVLFYPKGGYTFDCWSQVDETTLPPHYVTADGKHQVDAQDLAITREILQQVQHCFQTISA